MSYPPHCNADLHCHSIHSDGTLSPTELALRAIQHHVELWALTDHDTIDGLTEACTIAQQYQLPIVFGVEISCSFLSRSVHIVGLQIDIQNTTLIAGLHKVRSSRWQRAKHIAERLDALGFRDTLQGALALANSKEALSRNHFAQYLVNSRQCQHKQEAFTKYLGDGCVAYVELEWIPLQEAISLIHQSRGYAVLAHPGIYPFTPQEELQLLNKFKEYGGDAIEVICPSHDENAIHKYANFALEYGLKVSRGSDFHTANEARYDIGLLPPLPLYVRQLAIWKYFEHP